MRFRTEDREEIAGYVRELTAGSRQEPGGILYAPHTVESEPDTVLIYELYQDEAAVDAIVRRSTFAASRSAACTSACWTVRWRT